MSTSTKAISLLLGMLVMCSLFSLVTTVHGAINLGVGKWNTTTVDRAGSVGQ